MSTEKNIVIIGGGHGGVDLAKRLDAIANVTLVDGKSAFIHTPASIRAVTEPSLLKRIIMPYTGLLKRGKFVQGWVSNIEEDSVELADGSKLPADIIVAATGSLYATPFKHTEAGLEEYQAKQQEISATLADSQTVVIVGAGPVGIELAGEIATTYPDKKVHLVTDEAQLFPGYTPKLAEKLGKDLASLGVKLRTGQMVENLESLNTPYSGTVILQSGEKIEADLVFPVIGSKTQSELLSKIPGAKIATNGRVEHDGWMRPSPSRPTLFAVGDVLSTDDAMTIVALSRQIPWLEKTIKAVLADKKIESLKPYAAWPLPPIIVPIGPKLGATALPFGKQGKAVGHWMTSKMKGKDLFISKYEKLMGIK